MWTSPPSAIWDRMKDNHVFGPFWELSFGVIADGHAPTPMVRPESDGRGGVFVALRKSSDFQRLPSENLQSGNLADSDDGKRQGQAVFTFSSHLCVRMHFVCSRMQSVCTFSARAKN